ncbi:hypothetical protein ACS0TY_015785 [Phlomoides rotata]
MAEIEVPSYFLCPISLEIMKDPVTLFTGITYDRESIEKWIFDQKHNTCPITKQLLSDTDLTPNVTLRRLIQSWCTLHASDGVERLPTPKPPVSKPQISKLLSDARIPQMQMKSLQRLRSIASQNQTNKRSMENLGVAEFLASLIVKKNRQIRALSGEISSDLFESRKFCEEALAILYNLQLSESGLRSITASGEFIDCLTDFLQFGDYESRAYAVMMLKSMVEVSEPAQLINLRSGFFSGLARILKDQISQKASKATLKVLISVSPWGRNRIKAVEAGFVPILIDLLLDSSDKRSCEMTLMVLDFVCQCADGRAELLKHGAGLAIVSKKILRVSQVASERAVRILHSISRFSATPMVLQEMLQIGVVAKLCLLLQVDCGSKTKERAKEMLKFHARAWKNSSCIPNTLISSYP